MTSITLARLGGIESLAKYEATSIADVVDTNAIKKVIVIARCDANKSTTSNCVMLNLCRSLPKFKLSYYRLWLRY